MLRRHRMMEIHGVDAAAFAKRHGIEPFTGECYDCQRPRTTSVPFAYGKLRGLKSPTCACGDERGPYCVIMDDLSDLATALPPDTASQRKAARKLARKSEPGEKR